MFELYQTFLLRINRKSFSFCVTAFIDRYEYHKYNLLPLVFGMTTEKALWWSMSVSFSISKVLFLIRNDLGMPDSAPRESVSSKRH